MPKKRIGKGILQDIIHFLMGVRRKLPPKGRKLLETHGNKRIVQITLFRQPISKALEVLGNILSLGKWDSVKKQLHYDSMFHLGMILELQDGKILTTEKNQTPELNNNITYNRQAQFKNVPLKGKRITLTQFFSDGFKFHGESVYSYNASTANCQIYVCKMLQGNGLCSPEIEKWVKQDALIVMKTLPDIPKKFIDKLLEFASRADVLIKGAGLKKKIITLLKKKLMYK